MRSEIHDRAQCATWSSPFFFALAMATSLVQFSGFAIAAVPVEESVAGDRAPVAQPAEPSAEAQRADLETGVGDEATPDGAGRLSELFYRMQVMQQELQELRGALEEQSHQLKRIARDQQEQYIDLDRRVAALRNNVAAPAISTSTPAPPSPTSSGNETALTAYTDAFNLMKNRQFDESADAFNKLIVDYPNGQFTPNAFYWLGELYLAKAENEKARQSFVQVTNLYPDHQKAADALYKLGVVYHRLGDTARSLEYLGRVKAEHPQSSAASLAETYAAELR